ncbi:hypothetical protein EV656_102136 [Rhodovulum adriaticum]|uniref:Uncharacterized protein n=1 Tax=Rhodovulum adriaticum TaxID=35804 RepID=A0A4R2NVN1_RHOAD|nr:hypothetical protein EV656_102136 [Rhodovulum adriaticum]
MPQAPTRKTPPKGGRSDSARPRPTPKKGQIFTDWASI